MNTDWSEPYDSTNQSDVDAADRRIHFQLGWFANAIFSKDGDWPEVMKSLILNKSIAAGLSESRLPAFNQSEIDYVKGLHWLSEFQAFNSNFCNPKTILNKLKTLNDFAYLKIPFLKKKFLQMNFTEKFQAPLIFSVSMCILPD